jgi:hypothetical protein
MTNRFDGFDDTVDIERKNRKGWRQSTRRPDYTNLTGMTDVFTLTRNVKREQANEVVSEQNSNNNTNNCNTNQRPPDPPEKLIVSVGKTQQQIDDYNQKNMEDYHNKLAAYNNSNSKAVTRSSRLKRTA